MFNMVLNLIHNRHVLRCNDVSGSIRREKRMSEPTKRVYIYMPVSIYEKLKEIAYEKERPMTKVVIAILNGYLKSREARKKNGKV